MRGSRPNSNTNLGKTSTPLTRKRSFSDRTQNNNRDEEIKQLQERLALYEKPTQSKNDKRTPDPAPPNSNRDKKNKEVMDFLNATMKALETYKLQLTD